MTDNAKVDPKTNKDEANAETPEQAWPVELLKFVILGLCIIVFGGLGLMIIMWFIAFAFFGGL